MQKNTGLVIGLVISLLVNVGLGIIVGIAVFTHQLDLVMFNKSVPNVCESSLSVAEKAKTEATSDTDIATTQENYNTIKTFCDLVVE